jgi:hypothetical protein
MSRVSQADHRYNSSYRGACLERAAFPLGGIGAGMLCIEGTGAFSHVSLRHRPEVQNEPLIFQAIHLRGVADGTRVLEGPVPGWKLMHPRGGNSGSGGSGTSYGLPRFAEAELLPRFPFAKIALRDADLPVEVEMEAWSPFVPLSPDDSSLPVAALELRFRNMTDRPLEAVYSFSARNFMVVDPPAASASCCGGSGGGDTGAGLTPPRGVKALGDGFVLWQPANPGRPFDQGAFCARVPGEAARVDVAWFRGGWFDPLTMLWKEIASGETPARGHVSGGVPSPGGTVAVPFRLEPRGERQIRLLLAWHVPRSDLRIPEEKPQSGGASSCCGGGSCYEPWYASRYPDVGAVSAAWEREYPRLRAESARFRDAFFAMDLPPELVEAASANLSILKTPTVLRQADGRLWGFEGCNDGSGCCHGSCTHVWNYAQAIPHLFPSLERSLRETELGEGQDERGHQSFRVSLPIRQSPHDFHAAADGQLGGIVKVYREWRISGDTAWMRALWPRVRRSLEYCIETWDPRHRGVLEEPHHNTYDIEFWGPDGMCTSFYLAALEAACRMGAEVGDNVGPYRDLLARGRAILEGELWNGEYFVQKVVWQGLRAGDPTEGKPGIGAAYDSPEAVELLRAEGPKYQYGAGCISDGVLGFWLGEASGIPAPADPAKVASHLRSVYRHNFQADLSRHANPQRPTYAVGHEGGLLLCSWPRGGELSLPFPYAREVWTGIEYQVASHLMMAGMVEEGLRIVRAARDRYDGSVRDPFDEIECGHWYARAMASYGLIQGITGIRYDAVDRSLTVRPRFPGDYTSFLCTAAGYGHVGVRDGQVFVHAVSGKLAVERIDYVPCAPRAR